MWIKQDEKISIINTVHNAAILALEEEPFFNKGTDTRLSSIYFTLWKFPVKEGNSLQIWMEEGKSNFKNENHYLSQIKHTTLTCSRKNYDVVRPNIQVL